MTRQKSHTTQTRKDIDNLGQVFTPEAIVEKMIKLISNKNGRVLEPSCGDGAFSNRIPNCVAIEIDPTHAPPYAKNMDFFDFPDNEKFDVIIGNPPYVRYRDIPSETQKKMPQSLCDGRSGLHLHFVEKLTRHVKPGGEMILIIPRDFIKSTGAAKLNEYLHANGTITDFMDLGDKKIFDGATPNCAIFRWERGNLSHIMSDGRTVACHHGQFHFGTETKNKTRSLSEFFFVKVGGVSGADHIFADENGNEDFVCSTTANTGKTRRYIHTIETPHPLLIPHKHILISRKIRNFNEGNWWKWGREPYVSDEKRLYVNGKTRRTNPFFHHDCKSFDGSVLGLFPKGACHDFYALSDVLNGIHWDESGFVCDGRFLFSQRSLENAPIADDVAYKLQKLIEQTR